MEKEYLIKRWLNHELSPSELEAFKKLEDYDALQKLSSNLKHFKADHFDTDKELAQVLNSIKTKKQNSSLYNWLKPAMSVAAVIAICLGFYFYTSNTATITQTLLAEKTNVTLPDASEVMLNAKSKLSYNASSWDNKREINLDGEAYFKVAKGKTFEVKTKQGSVTVLGTQFNVIQRENYFEVICYEGSVKVDYNGATRILKPRNRFLSINNTVVEDDIVTETSPTWITHSSTFKSIPYQMVLDEFERQYAISISSKNIDTSALFTGVFTHNNIEEALKTITLPLHLKYDFKSESTIELSRE